MTGDLENLGYNPYRNVVSLLKDAPWPKLRIIYFTETFVTSEYLLPSWKKHVHGLQTLWIKEPIVKQDDWQRLADQIRTMFSTTTCDLWLDDPHPNAEDELHLGDNDDLFFTMRLRPNLGDLRWNERHAYTPSDLLGEDW